MDALLPAFAVSTSTSGSSLPWNASAVSARRAALPDRLLFFDRLLELAQVDRRRNYSQTA